MEMITAGTALAFTALSAFAGTWQQDTNGSWWRYDNGSWPAAQWEWIDVNNDNTARCYYFDGQGYAQLEGVTPDGYTLIFDGAAGAWAVDGVIQEQSSTMVAAALGTEYNGYYESPGASGSEGRNYVIAARDFSRKWDGTINIMVEIYGLASMEGTAMVSEEGFLMMDLTDANGRPVTAYMWPQGDLYNLTFTHSEWPLLKEGTIFYGFRNYKTGG